MSSRFWDTDILTLNSTVGVTWTPVRRFAYIDIRRAPTSIGISVAHLHHQFHIIRHLVAYIQAPPFARLV